MKLLSRLLDTRRGRTRIGRPRPRPAAARLHAAIETLEDRTLLSKFEVWTIDQSDTMPDGGGTLYIYRGSDLNGSNAASAVPDVIDLGGAARSMCLTQTGTAPRRPHMFFFNDDNTHAVISFVATGHVLFMDAATRSPVACVDVGVQAHAAVPAPDQSYVVVANQNGKLLQRINTNYATNTFTLDPAATINLATCMTPSGAACQDATLRPDNAPICPIIDSSSDFTFVTLRGGGLFVVDSTATPMSIVGEYDRATVHHDGCGGVEARGKMYINSGGPGESDLYAFALAGFDTIPNPPNTPAPNLVFSQDGGSVDSHGATLTKHDRYLWVGDRFANKVVVVDIQTDSVVGEINLAGAVSGDPAPDLMDIAPQGNRVFIALRGPSPLTGNNPTFNNAVGSTPGVGVVRVEQGGRSGEFYAVAPISHVDSLGVERADPHGLRVREIPHGERSGPAIAARVQTRSARRARTTDPLTALFARLDSSGAARARHDAIRHVATQRPDTVSVDHVLTVPHTEHAVYDHGHDTPHEVNGNLFGNDASSDVESLDGWLATAGDALADVLPDDFQRRV